MDNSPVQRHALQEPASATSVLVLEQHVISPGRRLIGFHTFDLSLVVPARDKSVFVHGVFERFPKLRCGYLEAGCGWVPSWLHRIDEQLEMAGEKEFPDLTMTATEYFRRNCFTTTECEERFVADVIRWMGDDHIVFESDFPHPDSKYPNATQTFLELAPDQISDASKRKILWDNALDFYRLPESYLPTEFTEPDSASTA